MATSSECEAIAAAGNGGKFRKKPFRRALQSAKPYDRPTAVRRGMGDTNNNGSDGKVSLFRKLVVAPASKIISYGAERFFASVFHNRLSQPPSQPHNRLSQPPSQPLEVSGESGDDHQMVTSHNQCCAQMSGGANGTQPLHDSIIDGISELEQLLMQKTFNRFEINHLTKLLQSKVVEYSLGVDVKRIEETPSDFIRHQPIAISPENRKDVDKSYENISTPAVNAQVIGKSMASPAEIAKVYMGNRPRVSFSMLETRKEVENDILTTKSQGKSAVYMTRAPYRSIHPISVHKGTGLWNNSSNESLMPSSHSVEEQDTNSEPRPMALKCRNSVLDDDVGSISRRVRQKPYHLSSRIPVTAHEVDTGFHYLPMSSKQKLPLVIEPIKIASKITGKDEVNSSPASNYAHVPSKSSEVAAKILQHLEKLTPKEKSAESKFVALGEKSWLSSTTSKLYEQSRGSVGEDREIDSLELQLDFQHGQKLNDRLTLTSPHTRVSTFPRVEAKQNNSKETLGFPNTLNPVVKNDFLESIDAPGATSVTSCTVVQNDVAQPPSKRSFKMSSQEDAGINTYCLPSRRMAGGPEDIPSLDNHVLLAKDPKPIKTAVCSNSRLSESDTSHALMIGEGISSITFPSLIAASEASHSQPLSHSVASFDYTRANDVPLLNLSSEVFDQYPPFSCQSIGEKLGSSSENPVSLVSDAKTKFPKLDRDGYPNPLKPEDAKGKYCILPSTVLNAPIFLKPPDVLSTASSYGTLQISTANTSIFTSSTSIANSGSTINTSSSSTSATLSGNPFGSNMASSILGRPILKFDASMDPSTVVSTALTSGLSSAADDLTANDPKGFASGSKSLLSGVGTVRQCTSNPSISSMPLPSFNLNSSTSLGISSFNPQFMAYQTSSFSFAASSSDSAAVISCIAPSLSVVGFGASSNVPVENAASSSSSSSPGLSSFGLGSFSSSASAVSSTNGFIPPKFSFGSSSTTTSVNAGSSFSNASSGVKNVSTSSTFSSSNNFLTSISSASSIFTSTWESHKSPALSSSPSQFSDFTSGEWSRTFGPANSSSMVLNSSPSPSPQPIFSFTTASPTPSLPSLPFTQPMFGNKPPSFAASAENREQMNAEDIMLEDSDPPSSIPLFSQSMVLPPVSTVPFTTNYFPLSSQQNLVSTQNPSLIQGSSNLDFSGGGGFSLGSGGGVDKSGRKFIKINRNKIRKK